MFLLDTHVFSKLRKAKQGKADAGVVAWAQSIQVGELYLSAIPVMELETGVLLRERKGAAQGALLRAWLDQHVLPGFAGRILAVDTGGLFRRFSGLKAQLLGVCSRKVMARIIFEGRRILMPLFQDKANRRTPFQRA